MIIKMVSKHICNKLCQRQKCICIHVFEIFVKAILVFDNNEFLLIYFENANKQSKKVIKELNHSSVCLFIYFLIYYPFKTHEIG